MKRKFIGLVFVISAMILVLISANASAATYGNLTYSVSNNKVTITDCSTSASGSLAIPSKINGYPVTSIGNWAFEDCSGLTSVEIPDSVTSIGYEAFSSCRGLTSVTIGNGVTSIGDRAFYDCSGLTNITVDVNNNYYSSDEYGVLFNKNKTELIQYPTGNTRKSYKIPDSVTSIGSSAFYGCSGLTSVEILDSVTSIGEDAFYGCSGLESVTIPDSVTSIGDDAFYYTGYYNNSSNWKNNVLYIGNYLIDAETSISGAYTIKEGTKCIGSFAFEDCSGLTSVEIPDSVTSIGEAAFYRCRGLTSVEIPDSVTSIGNHPFRYCSGLTSVEIPDSVTSIGEAAFYNCRGLTSVEIPDSVTSIGEDAFSGCSGLTSVVIPNSVTSIGEDAFSYCTGLTSVTIGNGIERIPASCFYYCSKLKKVTIGKKVSVIDANAFQYCSALETVVIPKSVIEIEAWAFSGCNSISTVEYAGSDGEWQEIYIGSDNGTLTSATVKYGVVLPVVISYNTNGGTGSLANQKAEEGGSIIISSVTPKKDGYKFLGWATFFDAKSAEYNPGEVLTVGEDNITLYAVWRKIVSMETDIINDIFIITPKGMENGNPIMFVCYNNGAPVYIDVFEYEGSAIVPFTCSEEYTEVKVMALDSLENLTPLCEAEEIATVQEISLLQLN